MFKPCPYISKPLNFLLMYVFIAMTSRETSIQH